MVVGNANRNAGEGAGATVESAGAASELLSGRGCASFSRVDHLCEQCGTEVESGRPFCPKCRAPQVRVEMEPLPPLAVSPSDLGTIPDPLSLSRRRASSDPALFRTALQAGLLGVMANLVPYGLGMVLTGVLAAVLYHRVRAGALGIGKAVRLGAVSGAISFAATALFAVLVMVLLNKQQEFHDLMMKSIEQGVANQTGPEVQNFLQWIHTSQGFGTVLAFGMLGALVLSMLLSAAGSVIGSTLFRGRSGPTL